MKKIKQESATVGTTLLEHKHPGLKVKVGWSWAWEGMQVRLALPSQVVSIGTRILERCDWNVVVFNCWSKLSDEWQLMLWFEVELSEWVMSSESQFSEIKNWMSWSVWGGVMMWKWYIHSNLTSTYSQTPKSQSNTHYKHKTDKHNTL